MNDKAIILVQYVESGDTEGVKSLIKEGVDVNSKDEDGWTPLHLAAYSGKKDVAKLLLDKGAEVTATITDGD